jgi:hypothetical protein
MPKAAAVLDAVTIGSLSVELPTQPVALTRWGLVKGYYLPTEYGAWVRAVVTLGLQSKAFEAALKQVKDVAPDPGVSVQSVQDASYGKIEFTPAPKPSTRKTDKEERPSRFRRGR